VPASPVAHDPPRIPAGAVGPDELQDNAGSRPRLPILPGPSTMHRLARSLVSVVLLLLACAGHAQVRTFPDGTKVGKLTVGNYPEASIDGKDVRFSPGARIFTDMNTTTIPMSVPAGTTVRYRTDGLGQIERAWVLTADEIADAKAQSR
jgi:hypothetical protein